MVIEPTSATKREVIYYTSKGASNVVCPSGAGNGRGYDGTSAASHADGASVIMAPVAAMWEALQDLSAVPATDVTPASTPLAWTNPYCFRAYNSSTTTLTDAADTQVLFQTEEYDYNNNFASSTYTAPVNGVYHFDANVFHSSSSATPIIAQTLLYVAGSPALYGIRTQGDTATNTSYPVSGDLYLTSGQEVKVYHYQNSAGDEATNTGSGLTYFSGHLVHAT